MKYTIGVDYGTDSCRVLIVNALTGEEIATAVKHYPRWAAGKYCKPVINQYRQHPLDYIETLSDAVKEALAQSLEGTAANVVGMSFDTTGSTPTLVDCNGTPLALLPEFADNPNAMFILWKDHTAVKEAAEINKLSKEWHTDYTAYEGGIYSSEWDWSKVLHVLRKDESLRSTAYSWIEHCDWMTALLSGNTKPETMLRSRCAAGHKAMWHADWGGLPSEEFLIKLDPLLAGYRKHLYAETHTCDSSAGNLTKEWAEKLGLTTNVAIGIGAIDCHMGAVGAQIKEGSFVRVMGTSTCDIMVTSYKTLENKLIPGICGQVDGSVIPGMIGLEAGQSAFGDLYAWWCKLLEWGVRNSIEHSTLADDLKEKIVKEATSGLFEALTKEAEAIDIEESTVIATDWMNGRRTPDANQLLTGTITGLTLGSTAPMIYRALVEATAYGSKAIMDRFLDNGIEIKEVIAIGGISQKSPFVMQILADVLNMPIKVARVEQACAMGAAMFAAVIAGVYTDIKDAQDAMGKGFSHEYMPNGSNHEKYMKLYEKYLAIGQFTEQQTK